MDGQAMRRGDDPPAREGPWRVRKMLRRDESGEAHVWVVYRLKDPAAPDRPENRYHYPNGKIGWCESEFSARRTARGLNHWEMLMKGAKEVG